MAITDGMLDIESHLAQCKANDEVFATRKLDAYIDLVAKNQRPGSPVVRPAAGFFDAAQQNDGRKVQRQHQLLEEQIAFVLGHELAHHYLAHLPCTASDGMLTASEWNRAITGTLPAFNQVNESAADTAGTYNVLDAGAKRQGNKLTEAGGLLTMQFFAGFDRLTPGNPIFDFERTHPPANIRTPLIQQAANGWRSGFRVPL
jgi:hypothetical protein